MALAAGAVYVYRKSENPRHLMRALEAGASGLMGYSLGPDLAVWAGLNPAVSHILITTLGYLALDVLTAVVADRQVFKDIIIRYLGGKSNGTNEDS